MKIALFSDIHANLPAFESVLRSIEEQKPDAIYCLGDLVGYSVWPNEVIDAIRMRQISTISGNHDAKVRGLSEIQLTESGKDYAYSIIGGDQRRYLATLPSHIRVEFKFNYESIRLLLVHGSPSSNEEYLLEEKPEHEFLNVFQNADCDILCFGHSHKPYHRVLTKAWENQHQYYHAINTGSVGKPKDGDPRACYVLSNIHDSIDRFDAESIDVHFVRVEYDVEIAAKAIEKSSLPAEFAEMLRKAY
ncbi:MAG: metallophosphoesterase [Chitinophagaceae bacterium]|nr:MAG: metallophosphoesterase [Chitinophagaceae bacterium]